MPQVIYWGDAPYEVPEQQDQSWDWVECEPETEPSNQPIEEF